MPVGNHSVQCICSIRHRRHSPVSSHEIWTTDQALNEVKPPENLPQILPTMVGHLSQSTAQSKTPQPAVLADRRLFTRISFLRRKRWTLAWIRRWSSEGLESTSAISSAGQQRTFGGTSAECLQQRSEGVLKWIRNAVTFGICFTTASTQGPDPQTG